MATEKEYVEVLPFLGEWDSALRSQFVEGMHALQDLSFPSPDLSGLIAVLVLDEHGVDVRILTKEACLRQAEASGLDPDLLDAIASPPLNPGTLDMLVLAHKYHLVVGVPMDVVRIPLPGSQNN